MNCEKTNHQQSLIQYEHPIVAIYAEMMQASEVGDTLRVAELNEQVQPLIESYFNSEIEFIKSHSGDYLGHYLLNLTK